MTDDASWHNGLRIGTLASEFGLNPKTLRYYESLGLLRQPPRTAAGYRLYGAVDRDQLRFIVKAKALGFTLEEIGEILALRDAGTEPCVHVRALIDARLEAVTTQVRLLEELRGELEVLHTEAQNMPRCGTSICSIIELHASPRRDGASPSPTASTT